MFHLRVFGTKMLPLPVPLALALARAAVLEQVQQDHGKTFPTPLRRPQGGRSVIRVAPVLHAPFLPPHLPRRVPVERTSARARRLAVQYAGPAPTAVAQVQ